MSREQVVQSLEAVEQALTHLAGSLERGGFEAGAPAYQQMVEVVLGQRLWVEAEGIDDLDPRFRAIGVLADRVRRHLRPYVDGMQRLASLAHLVPAAPPVDPETLAGRVYRALTDAGDAQSASRLRAAVGASTRDVHRALDELAGLDLVVAVGSSGRTKYRALPPPGGPAVS